MSSKVIGGKVVELDADGHLVDYKEWTKEMAPEIAVGVEIENLAEGHWKVIDFMRSEYEENGAAPSLRKITKLSGVNTKEMYALFPKGPAKKAAMIAGLPKPKGCI